METREGLYILLIAKNETYNTLFREAVANSKISSSVILYVSSLAEAFAAVSSQSFNLLIIDPEVPSSDNLDLYTWTREISARLPVLFIGTNISLDGMHGLVIDAIEEDDIQPRILEKVIPYQVEKFRLHRLLSLSDQRYEQISRVTNDIIWEWNLETGILYFNSEGWKKIFGKENYGGVISFDGWMSHVHPADKANVINSFQEVISNKRAMNFELEYRMKGNGDYLFVVEKGYIIRDKKRKALKLIGSTRDVTDIRHADEELKKLSLIARETQNVVIITDAEGYINWTNEAFSKISGYGFNEVKGKKPGDVLQGSETSKASRKYMSRKLKLHKPFECDVLNYNKNGNAYWVRIFCQPQFTVHGELESYFAILTDITAKKENEELLKANERKYRTLVENSKDGLAVISPEGMTLDILSGGSILGYTKEDYNRGKELKFIHPDDEDRVFKAFSDIISNPSGTSTLEYRALKKSGTYTWIESTFHNMLDEPSIGAIIANFRDINERKVSESLIKISEEKYRNLFINNPLALIVWDPVTYAIYEVNESAEKEYGYSREEFLKLNVQALIDPELRKRFEDTAAEILKDPDFHGSYTSKNYSREGKVLFMDVSFQPIEYFGKTASLAMVKNITDRVELEEKLALERQEKQREITDAAVTAQEQERLNIGWELHDNINQILATTRLYIEYALSNKGMQEQLLVSAKDLVLSAVQEIRKLSKTLLPPSISEVGLKSSLEDLFESLRKVKMFMIESNIELDEERLPENLKLTIFRIIQEQMNNIIKHAMATSVKVSIDIQDDTLTLIIKDNGKGIDPVKKAGGVGLKNITNRAALHNGTMTLDSAPGKGTVLKVNFIL